MRIFDSQHRNSPIGRAITWTLSLLVCVYILASGGCDFSSSEVVKETNEPGYVRAMEELRRGNHSEAMLAFMKLLEKRKDAPESNFELGRIYLDQKNDPISAIYHFKKFLELKPNAQNSPMVRQMIETAQKRFAASLPESPFENNIRRMELEDIVQKLQRENLELKQKLASSAKTIDRLESTQQVRVATSPTPSVRQTPQQNRASASGSAQNQTASPRQPAVAHDAPDIYTVQPGDTLSSISRKMYGTPNRWREIFKHNRDRMATPESLKAGQTLRIPKP